MCVSAASVARYLLASEQAAMRTCSHGQATIMSPAFKAVLLHSAVRKVLDELGFPNDVPLADLACRLRQAVQFYSVESYDLSLQFQFSELLLSGVAGLRSFTDLRCMGISRRNND